MPDTAAPWFDAITTGSEFAPVAEPSLQGHASRTKAERSVVSLRSFAETVPAAPAATTASATAPL